MVTFSTTQSTAEGSPDFSLKNVNWSPSFRWVAKWACCGYMTKTTNSRLLILCVANLYMGFHVGNNGWSSGIMYTHFVSGPEFRCCFRVCRQVPSLVPSRLSSTSNAHILPQVSRRLTQLPPLYYTVQVTRFVHNLTISPRVLIARTVLTKRII